jgi:superfamily I DNA and/or RNA helicase
LLITVLVLAVLVVYYLLLTDYVKQHRENNTLAYQINEATQMLAQVPTSPADLEQRLKTAQSDYEAEQNSLPERLNTTRTIDFILKLAEAEGVKAIPLITQPWSLERVGSYDYSVFRLDVTASGTYTKLAGFIEQLETSELDTLIIESLSVERAADEPAEEGTTPVRARLAIAVYARPPAGDDTEKAE